jgi:hypothetical protein
MEPHPVWNHISVPAHSAGVIVLGASRDTITDQTKYLMDIASRFQEVVALALDAKC